jgi:hypothetical protein
MRKSGTELKHVDSSSDLSESLIASAISCTTIQRLRLQSVRSHADAKPSMHHLDFVAVVILSICRHFCHFLYLSMVEQSSLVVKF